MIDDRHRSSRWRLATVLLVSGPRGAPGGRPLGDGGGFAVASRMEMLAVLSVGWLPTESNLLYLSPASPFFLFAVACGIAAGVRTIGAVRAADA